VTAADLQAAGVIGLVSALAALVGACTKGVWDIISSARKGRTESKAADAASTKTLHDAAQEGIMAFNEVLKGDNARLRVDLAKAEEEIRELKHNVDDLRDENTELRHTVGLLTLRLERLERSNGD
jgi:hypothetical protein